VAVIAEGELPKSPILEVVGPEHAERETTWVLKGELDVSSVGLLQEALRSSQGCLRLVLDMTDLVFMDSAGVAMLLRAAEVPGCVEVVLRNPRQAIRRVCEITGLDQHPVILLEPSS